LPTCYILYVTIGICSLFISLIAIYIIDDKRLPKSALNVRVIQIHPDQTVDKKQMLERDATATKEKGTLEEIIISPSGKQSEHSPLKKSSKVHISNETEIERTDASKLTSTGDKFLLFHSYLTPFHTIPDSLNRHKKMMLLFLRVITIYFVSGFIYTYSVVSPYLIILNNYLPTLDIIKYVVYGAISVIISAIVCYLFGFMLVTPSAERIALLKLKRGNTSDESVFAATKYVNTIRVCNIFGYIVVALAMIVACIVSLILPSNYDDSVRYTWLVTFGFGIGLDMIVFQLVKVFLLLCFLKCTKYSSNVPANNCCICWTSTRGVF